jgi:hypothetical protein
MSAHASNVIRYAVCTRRFVDKGDEFSILFHASAQVLANPLITVSAISCC